MDSGSASNGTAATPLRVALIEDDVELRDAILAPGLTKAGFSVTAAGSAGELYRAMLTRTFDVVVLDVSLPDENGFDVLRHLRGLSSVGIVMLTGRGGDSDRVQGLDLGADAYLSKPVEVGVLAATLRSLARRLAAMRTLPPAGAWRLDGEDWRLMTPSGRRIDLTPSERAVMRCLFDAAGDPVARESLIAALGEDVHDFDPHRLDALMHRLRRKIEGVPETGLMLKAVRGKGYLLVLDGGALGQASQ